MESTPRPITGDARPWPSRIPLPLEALARGVRGLARPTGQTIVMVRPEGTEALVEVQGTLDAKGALRLKQAVSMAFDEGAERVVIDLSGATRIAAAGVAALVEATLAAGASRVQLARVTPEVRLLLERAGLHRVLEMVE